MKLARKIIAGMLSVSLSVTSLMGISFNVNSNGAKAESLAQDNAITVLETDVETASEGCTMLGVYGSYFSQAEDALNRINEIRKEACDAGDVPDPRDPSRMLTPNDYVPIRWSKDLESIARIRAMEGGLAYSFLSSGHNRLNGKDIWSVQYNGVRSYAEDLAYNWGNSMESGINQWYEEKGDWVSQTQGKVTGHYTSMINPVYTYVGLGDFYTKLSKFPNTLAGAFCSSSQNLDQSMQAEQTNILQKIEVKNSYIEGYILEGEETVDVGGTTELALRANLVNGSQTLRLWVLEPVTYASSDTSVAQVTEAGAVIGRNEGTTTITVKSGNNELASISITVKAAVTAAPSLTPEATQTQKPSESPCPSSEATSVPEGSVSPSPSATQVLEESPLPSVKPAQQPSESPSTSAKPAQIPSESPLPSVKPAQQPSESPSTSAKPAQIPSESPLPSVKPAQKPSESPSTSAKPAQIPSESLSPSFKPAQQPSGSFLPLVKPSRTPAPVQAEDVKNPDAGYEKPSGINVRYHTQEEIRSYAKNSNVSLNDALEFAEEPVTQKPYSFGKLSDKTLHSALLMLNQIRYIAGISDNVELSDEYNTLCQAGTLANYANNKLSHYPEKPDGMSDDMYELAKNGAGSSNIAWASWSGCSLNETIVSNWMEDGDAGNIDRVGHRRWLLNPDMGKTGFGAVSGKNGTYSAVYSFDESHSPADEYGVAWPAQNMPVEYFGTYFPWSISMGCHVDEANVKVTLTRVNDGKTWNFSDSSSDGSFYVNNSGYGQNGCIIFRPNSDITYNAGDLFKVKITGLKNDVSYTVNFFSLNISSEADANNKTDIIKTGVKITDKNSKAVYKVTGTGKNRTVEYIKSTKQKPERIIIPDSIKINGRKYKVTSIGKNAFKNNRKLKSVTIGKNVIMIGARAFSGCKKLRSITIHTDKLTASNIGKNAFSKGYSKTHVKANKRKCKLYKKIFKARGMSKKCKFTAL